MKRTSAWRSVAPAKCSLWLAVAFLAWASVTDSVYAQASAHTVTNVIDGGPGSLREEIATAQSGDTISFAVRGAITLTNGELLITNSLRIVGPGATNLAISARGQSRVLEILPGTTVGLSGLTICDGHALDGSAGTSNSPAGGDGRDGGGIYNAGFLTISQCVISNCTAGSGAAGYLIRTYYGSPDATNWTGGIGGNGGGIYNAGRLLLVGSSLTSNSSGAGGDGGGAGEYGTAGSSGGGGGALYNAGMMMLMNCTLEHNTAGNGGIGYSLIYRVFVPTDGGLPGGAGGRGGAVCDAGTATTFMFDCAFNFNSSGAGAMGTTTWNMFRPALGGVGGAGGGGGAIWAQGLLQLNGCTFLSNQTGPGAAGGWGLVTGGVGGIGGPGGAICALSELSMTRCSCASNHTASGGNGGSSYVGLAGSGGSGGWGGAVYAQSALQLNDSTFSGNSAGSGGDGGSNPTPQFYPFGPGGGGIGGHGGALYCRAELGAVNCIFSGNQAGDAGGPGVVGPNPNFSSEPTTSGSSGGEGGAIFGLGPIVLTACTVNGNVGGRGSDADGSGPGVHPKFIYYERIGGAGGAGGAGGIYTENRLRMTLCTLSGNVGGTGGSGGLSWGGFPYEDGPRGGAGGSAGHGAVSCFGSNELTLVACTIAGNSGGPGGSGGYGDRRYNGQSGSGTGGAGGVGGVFNASPALSASVINNIVASNIGGTGGAGAPMGNTGAADLEGAFSSLGHNLIGQTDGSFGLTNGVNDDLAGSAIAPLDPLLGPLADNGGPTFTMALLHGSPALDAGDDALRRPPYQLRNDQRGFPRKSGPDIDIGAFESQFQSRDPHSSPQGPVLFGAFSPNGNSQAYTANGSITAPNFQLTFSDNTPGATFTILVTTNLSPTENSWSVLGQPIKVGPSLFQFTDVQAGNNPQRFYRVSSP